MSSPLFDGPMDRIARSEDLHLLQALRRTAASLGERPAEDEPEHTDRLRTAVRGLVDDVGNDRRTPANSEAIGEEHERFYNVDQELVDRTRAALMAYHDRPTPETARLAAEQVEALAGADRG
jgi:hypothetical protein